MKIQDLFQKDINRNIETVIKADDREHISDEVNEYVITQEISQRIRDFFGEYNNYRGANGVWISGFFGCGKSHLLKILSYVIENKEFNGYKSGEVFADKIKDDELLKADILAAISRPSESILFNIDQQAQITSKADENAILSVFYKVFYDHLGYYGSQSHVAQFEMWLDQDGLYDKFIVEFKQRYDLPWEEARREYFDPRVNEVIAQVLGILHNKDASKYGSILDDIEDKHKQSIEDFAQRVHDYIKTKSKNFRLNFFVDEVGQYISENTKLMLNLQTIAETLATKTNGAAWILVTSQEDIKNIMGDMNQKQQNDFSRIQARFKIKIPLTSANVDEVIEKRLLMKNDAGKTHLLESFTKNEHHLSTLLTFSEAGRQFRGYRGKDDYINKFPFIPYQFDLFKECRRELSKHNAFQGRHASVGERSMLGVFQQVAQSLNEKNEQVLVSFDMMYEGIRSELISEIQNSLIIAEKNLGDSFALQVLKALFLVKYYNSFKPTRKNIEVMMINDINIDLKKHQTNIQQALDKLENQSYIQRNGDIYEFLTDTEKDVENEIKDTIIDDQVLTQKLKEILFDGIIKDNKIQYVDNKSFYDFTGKIDGAIVSREKELEIEIITENHPNYKDLNSFKVQTMGTSGMKLVLPSDAVFMKDLRINLQTEKYVKQHFSASLDKERRNILNEKAQMNAERFRNLKDSADKLLSKSTVLMNGGEFDISPSSDGRSRVIKAFQALIKTAYPNLSMLKGEFTEDTLKSIIKQPMDDLFGGDDNTISEAEHEVLNFIKRQKTLSERTSLNDLKNHFMRKPYGWYANGVWAMVAKLYKRGKIEAKQDSNTLENEDMLAALLNSAQHSNTLLVPQTDIDPACVIELKKIYSQAFDESCPHSEAKDVALAFRDKLKDMSNDVNRFLVLKQNYPFLDALTNFSDQLERWSRKDYVYYLEHSEDFKDALLEAKETLFSPIQRFMNGEQRKIYDDVYTVLSQQQANLEYVDGEKISSLRTVMEDTAPYRGDIIRQAKSVMTSLKKDLETLLDQERSYAIKEYETAIKEIESRNEYSDINADDQTRILSPLKREIEGISHQSVISVIRLSKTEKLGRLRTDQLNLMIRLSSPPEDKEKPDSTPIIEYMSLSQIQVDYPKLEIGSDTDANDYAEALKKALKAKIKDNKRITVN